MIGTRVNIITHGGEAMGREFETTPILISTTTSRICIKSMIKLWVPLHTLIQSHSRRSLFIKSRNQ